MLIIGERINVFASRKVRQALDARDELTIIDIAREQHAQGASFLDVHAEGWDDMKWMLETVNKAGVPLCLDSPDIDVIRKGLAMPNVGFLNSLGGGRLDLFREAREHKVKVVGLLHDVTAAEVVAAADRAGYPREDLYLDPAVLPVSVDASNARRLVDKHRAVKKEFPQVKTIVGISNITHGMPRVTEIRAAVLITMLNDGLDGAICNPAELGFFARAQAILGDDGKGKTTVDYIRAFRKDEAARKPAQAPNRH